MRSMLVLGSLCALFATGCDSAVLIGDLKCGKDGKVKGELALVLFGDEESQSELEGLSCEDKKELKQELKLIKVAIGTVENNEFTAVVCAKKYEVDDENCDGYEDLVYEFSVKKLVCEGLLDKNTEELAVGYYYDGELEGWGYLSIENEEDGDCEKQKDCDNEKQSSSCDKEESSSCEKKKEECNKDEQTSSNCEKKEYTKDCSNQQPS